jgi:xanthine/CO dehydrogenase XdhC/CoxF family maturation factor
VLESDVDALPVGTSFWSGDGQSLPGRTPAFVSSWIGNQVSTRRDEATVVELADPKIRLFVASPPRLRNVLVIGGGPDAQPLVEYGATMGWYVTLVDHRPAYSKPELWPRAHRVLTLRPGEYPRHMDLAVFDAAVIMSHHLPTDLAALATLAPTPIPYVGLLGPEPRRRQLLADLGEASSLLQGRLHAPIGLQIGGRDPQSIALSIAAELQAVFHGRT